MCPHPLLRSLMMSGQWCSQWRSCSITRCAWHHALGASAACYLVPLDGSYLLTFPLFLFVWVLLVVSYPQEEVVTALLAVLRADNEVAFKPLLALLGVLARDLREELFPFFERILDRLVSLINPTKPALTGEVFRTLSYLFKYLAPQLLKNLDAVRGYYGPLLGHAKPYVREFAAQSFSFLLRKVCPRSVPRGLAMAAVLSCPAMSGRPPPVSPLATYFLLLLVLVLLCALCVFCICVLLSLLSVALQLPEASMASHTASLIRAMGPQAALPSGEPVPPRPAPLRDGIALLLFETCKGVQYGFHSRMPAVLSAALGVCRPKAFKPSSASATTAKAGGKKRPRKATPAHSDEDAERVYVNSCCLFGVLLSPSGLWRAVVGLHTD